MQSSFKSFPFPYSPSVLPLSFSSALSWFLLPFPFPRAIEHSLLHCPKSFPNLTCSLGSLCPFRLPLSASERKAVTHTFGSSSPIPFLLHLIISVWVVHSALPISLGIHCPFHLPLSGSDRKAVARTLSYRKSTNLRPYSAAGVHGLGAMGWLAGAEGRGSQWGYTDLGTTCRRRVVSGRRLRMQAFPIGNQRI